MTRLRRRLRSAVALGAALAATLLLLVAVGTAGWAAPADAQPQPPHRFFGTVSTPDGEAVTGATVEVVYRGEVVANDTTDDTGYYDLKVPADEVDADENRTLVLTVRDASKRRTFESGGSDEVNFVVGGGGTSTPTATPSPTPTKSTPTPSPSPTRSPAGTRTGTATDTRTPSSGGTGATDDGADRGGGTTSTPAGTRTGAGRTDGPTSPSPRSPAGGSAEPRTDGAGSTRTPTASPAVGSPPTGTTTTAGQSGFGLVPGIVAVLAAGLIVRRRGRNRL